MLTNIIPDAWRKGVYAAYAFLIVALGAVAAGFAAAQLSQPSWIIVAGSVLLYVGAAIGATAASNVSPAAIITLTDTAATTPTAAPVAAVPGATDPADGTSIISTPAV